MITQYEVPGLLREEIPSMTIQPFPGRASLEIYAAINSFTEYTKHAVQHHNLSLAGKCFALAEKLYRNGDALVRLLIENSFIYSITSYIPFNAEEKQKLKAVIPAGLYNAYLKQATQSGC